jgi:hypothetical protein
LSNGGKHEAELSNLPKANRQLPCARWCLTHARKNVGGKDFGKEHEPNRQRGKWKCWANLKGVNE